MPRPTRTDVNHEFAANSSFLYDLIATWITSHNSARGGGRLIGCCAPREGMGTESGNGFSFKLRSFVIHVMSIEQSLLGNESEFMYYYVHRAGLIAHANEQDKKY